MTGKRCTSTGLDDFATRTLASWASRIGIQDLPEDTITKAAECLVDWVGVALAGSAQHVAAFVAPLLDDAVGAVPHRGASTLLRARLDKVSCTWAAFLNGFNGQVLGLGDIHKDTLLHPGAAVIPAALACAERCRASGSRLLTAIVVGYEVCTRVGEAAGTSHHAKWNGTGTCGVFGAAAAAGKVLGLDDVEMCWALGHAGAHASGLRQLREDGALEDSALEYPASAHSCGLWHAPGRTSRRGRASGCIYIRASGPASGHSRLRASSRRAFACVPGSGSKCAYRCVSECASSPLHAAYAATNGLLAALLAKHGFGGPVRILEGEKGFLRTMSSEPTLEALTDRLGERHRICEVSMMPYPSCRHSHAQVDAALEIAAEPGFDSDGVRAVRIRTYGAAIEVAGGGGRYPRAPREAIRSSPYCVAVALQKKRLGPRDFRPDAIRLNDYARRLVSKTTLEAGEELDAEYPKRRGAEVEVTMDDGATLSSSIMLPKGDPENPMSLEEVCGKAAGLAEIALPHEQAVALVQRVADARNAEDVSMVFDV